MPTGALIGALAGPILGGLASGAVGLIGSQLFGGGGGGGSVGPSFANASGGGLRSTLKDGTVSVTSSGERNSLVGRISATFPEQAAILKKLRDSVTPGSSALRNSRLLELENARRSATGDLRDNLARRRVLGSSFAQDSLTRADLAFEQQADKIKAESFLQELELTNALTSAEFDARRGQFQTGLDELNLEANMATQLATGATTQLGANARVKAQLDADAAAGAGKFFGQIGAPIGDAVGKAVSGFFQPKAA